MKNVVVVGGGTMGNGIAHAAAASGFDVSLVDVSDAILQRAVTTITANLQRGVDKGKMTAEQRDGVLARIRPTTDMDSIANADIAIEAIIENLEAKTNLFKRLDEITGPETILASNTSSISITRIASSTKRPDRVIGMHFMNPVPVMTLVEVIRGMAEGRGSREADGKDADRGQRLSRVHLEPRPHADDQRGDLCSLRRRCHARVD
jgi:3-hydroxybutyryl-CoA dehydrogenase